MATTPKPPSSPISATSGQQNTPQTPEQKRQQEEREKQRQEEHHREQERQKREDEQKSRAREDRASRDNSVRSASTGRDRAGSLAYTPGAGTISAPIPDPRGVTTFTHDEVEELAGEVTTGQVAWLKLNEEGTPEGEATTDLPIGDDEQNYARVVGAPGHKYDAIVTPSGAPITRFMNPEMQMWDQGMLARNPIPEENMPKAIEERLQERGISATQAGAPVINQPVA